MKIELKKIAYNERLSQETNAFAADLYIDGRKAGIASNEGHGGPTNYYATTDQGRALIREAETFCKGQPPIEYPGSHGMKPFKVPMDLEHYIDNLLEKYLNEKSVKVFRAKLEKQQSNHVHFGIPDKQAASYKLRVPITELLKYRDGPEWLKGFLTSTVLPEMKPGERILNTNIPEEILLQAGLTQDQYVKKDSSVSEKTTVKKQHKPRR